LLLDRIVVEQQRLFDEFLFELSQPLCGNNYFTSRNQKRLRGEALERLQGRVTEELNRK
jgi:hypothetical protein